MNNKPTFSIITVCLNSHNLRQTCDSIIKQTCQDFEWIVIDGGSQQKTLDIFEQYKDRINFFVSEKDNGIYNAMNKGIQNSSGKYLLFMNGGDFFDSAYTLERFAEEGLDKDIIYANVRLYAGHPAMIQPDVLTDYYLMTNTLPHQATLIKKEVFDICGLYNEQYRVVSDYEKWIQALYVNHCTYKHINFVASCFDCTGISSDCNNYLGERRDVVLKYFTKAGINKIINKRLSWLQKIFSVTPWVVNKSLLDITVLGWHIQIRRKKTA